MIAVVTLLWLKEIVCLFKLLSGCTALKLGICDCIRIVLQCSSIREKLASYYCLCYSVHWGLRIAIHQMIVMVEIDASWYTIELTLGLDGDPCTEDYCDFKKDKCATSPIEGCIKYFHCYKHYVYYAYFIIIRCTNSTGATLGCVPQDSCHAMTCNATLANPCFEAAIQDCTLPSMKHSAINLSWH